MKIYKKIIVIFFISVLFMPMFLLFSNKLFEKNFDVKLKGFTDNIEEPKFNLMNICTRNFQKNFEN